MSIKVTLPEADQVLEEGTILVWKVKEGDQIKKGEILLEIETPKAIIEVEAPTDGILKKILYKEGETIALKETIALIEPISPPEETPGEHLEALAEKERILASPAAKRLAREKGINLEQIKGSGPGGRIQEVDVLAYAESPVSSPPPTFPAALEERRVRLSPLRKAIARKLVYSVQNIPHFYLTTEVDARVLWETYQKIKNKYDVSLNDFIIKATATALKEFPEVNSQIEADFQIFKAEINIGVAVDLEEGLKVVVLQNADKMSLLEIAENSKKLIQDIREGKTPRTVTGTFTISNLGMYDIIEFVAIINPPETAILAIGKIYDKLVLKKDGIMEIGKSLKLTLSGDHRAFSGVSGAKFLSRIKALLETSQKWHGLFL